MDWNQIQQQWQTQRAPANGEDALTAVRARDDKLRATLRRRDRLETVVAVAIAPIFAYAAWRAGLRGAWGAMAFCVWLAVWAAYVPWHFWRVRRRLPKPHHELPLIDYLRQEHDAMQAQARMLEQVWLWYLAPCAIGVIGLNIAALGVTVGSLIYTAVVLVFCLVVERLNRYAARTQFRDLAAQIEQQISRLNEEIRP